MPQKILQITPQTQVRSTQGDKIFFRIPEDKLRPEGLKRKKRLLKYNQYKSDLFDVAQEANFSIPEGHFHVIFYIPIAKTVRKKRRLELHLRPHRSRPDWDNLAKGFCDALLKRDESIHDIHVQKVWIDGPGHIEINW